MWSPNQQFAMSLPVMLNRSRTDMLQLGENRSTCETCETCEHVKHVTCVYKANEHVLRPVPCATLPTLKYLFQDQIYVNEMKKALNSF